MDAGDIFLRIQNLFLENGSIEIEFEFIWILNLWQDSEEIIVVN